MSSTATAPALRRRLLPLALYTLALGIIYLLYLWGSRSERFMLTLDTLWPVVAFTLLLVLVIANALMLARGIPLWLLAALHIVLMAVWLAFQWISARNHAHEHGDGHVCGISWVIIPITLLLSILPTLFGHLLLQTRKRRLQKQQEADTEQFAFQSPADILADADTAPNAYKDSDDDAGADAGDDLDPYPVQNQHARTATDERNKSEHP